MTDSATQTTTQTNEGSLEQNAGESLQQTGEQVVETKESNEATPQTVAEATQTLYEESPAEKAEESQEAAQTQSEEVAQQSENESSEEKPTDESAVDYNFTAPEGQEYNSGVIQAYTETVKELNINPENAQKILDAVAPAMQSASEAALQETARVWGDQFKADKEFGGDKFDKSIATVKKLVDTYGDSEARDFLENTVAGSNPGLLKMLAKIGNSIGEDSYVSSGTKPVSDEPMTLQEATQSLYD